MVLSSRKQHQTRSGGHSSKIFLMELKTKAFLFRMIVQLEWTGCLFKISKWVKLIALYPRSAGQSCSTPIWPHTFHKRLTVFSSLFHIEKTQIFSKFSIWKEKSNKDSRKERTWTEDHSLKNLRSIHLGYLRADDCRWKKVDQTISHRTATDYLYWYCSAGYTETRCFRLALFK